MLGSFLLPCGRALLATMLQSIGLWAQPLRAGQWSAPGQLMSVAVSNDRTHNAAYNFDLHVANKRFLWTLSKYFRLMGWKRLFQRWLKSIQSTTAVFTQRWYTCATAWMNENARILSAFENRLRAWRWQCWPPLIMFVCIWTEGHRFWYQSKAHIQLTIND